MMNQLEVEQNLNNILDLPIDQKLQILSSQNKNQVFYCQCGKNYLSFPALYLHAKNKHKIKLTSKMSDRVCKIQKNDQKTHITYFLNPDQNSNQSHKELNQAEKTQSRTIKTYNQQAEIDNQFKIRNNKNDGRPLYSQQKQKYLNSLNQVINNYIQDINFHGLRSLASIFQIMKKFMVYVNANIYNSKQFQIHFNKQNSPLINELPLFFNDFIISSLNLLQETHQESKQTVNFIKNVIHKFGQWLQANNHTNLITQLK